MMNWQKMCLVYAGLCLIGTFVVHPALFGFAIIFAACGLGPTDICGRFVDWMDKK